MPETFFDFWRMVWEQNTRVIVMMTRLEERARVKCDQYWPNRGEERFANPYEGKSALQYNDTMAYSVSVKDSAEFAYYTVRTFALQRHSANGFSPNGSSSTDGAVREVKHFQFTAWPDYGTPDHPQPLLLFIRRVNQLRSHMLHQLQQEHLANGEAAAGFRSGNSRTNTPSSVSQRKGSQTGTNIGPTVVHCSAGVGRTGWSSVILTVTLFRKPFEAATLQASHFSDSENHPQCTIYLL